MNVDAAAEAEAVNHEVETMMNMKVTMKIMMMTKTKMIMDGIVIWVPVVTRKTGMRMIMKILVKVAEAVDEE
jgi:hypothetical protein